MLLLNEDEVQRLLSMNECIVEVEAAFRSLGSGRAYNLPRGRIRSEPFEGKYSYWMNCIPGAVPDQGVAALRIDSAVQILSEDLGRTRGGHRDNCYCGTRSSLRYFDRTAHNREGKMMRLLLRNNKRRSGRCCDSRPLDHSITRFWATVGLQTRYANHN
jgi:hypothetical protein